jgi:hypothetical protein
VTKKRWMVLVGLLAVGVCVTLTVLALLPPRPGVTQANFDRIEVGMTLEEVETILGGPGDLIAKNGTLIGAPGAAVAVEGNLYDWCHPWRSTNVSVSFDDRDRVVWKSFFPESYFQTLCSFFGL